MRSALREDGTPVLHGYTYNFLHVGINSGLHGEHEIGGLVFGPPHSVLRPLRIAGHGELCSGRKLLAQIGLGLLDVERLGGVRCKDRETDECSVPGHACSSVVFFFFFVFVGSLGRLSW